jgi:RNA polymerase sigma-54 factor
MRLAHIIEARQQQSQRIDPRQILASEILAWTTSELEAAVESEISQNPALEAHEIGGGGGTGITESSVGENGGSALPSLLLSSENISSVRLPASAMGNNSPWNGAGGDDDALDPLDRVASSTSLRDHLRAQVGQVTDDPIFARLTRRLIECVDDRGYLSTSDIDDVAASLQAASFEAEAAVRALQKMDPPGVGARTLHECLLLQSDYLDQTGEGHALAHRILLDCWEDLPARNEQRIASRLRATVSEVKEALRFIQTSFAPYPGAAFRPEGLLPRGNQGSAAVRPDLVFHRSEAGFTVELTRDYETSLSVAPLWQRLAEKPDTAADEAMRRYIRDHVERAQRFLNGVSRRGQTLRRIAASLMELQPGYLETGNRAFLRPLTRQTLAESLGLDESVVSRAVADKWVQLPSGEVVALDAFFGNSHAIRDALAALIAAENPRHPYSDDEIADILSAQGFPLARRTVAKYRSLEKILPARLRRRSMAA